MEKVYCKNCYKKAYNVSHKVLYFLEGKFVCHFCVEKENKQLNLLNTYETFLEYLKKSMEMPRYLQIYYSYSSLRKNCKNCEKYSLFLFNNYCLNCKHLNKKYDFMHCKMYPFIENLNKDSKRELFIVLLCLKSLKIKVPKVLIIEISKFLF